MGAALTTAETKQALIKSLERFDVSKLSAGERRIFRENARRFRSYLKKLNRQTPAAPDEEEETNDDPA